MEQTLTEAGEASDSTPEAVQGDEAAADSKATPADAVRDRAPKQRDADSDAADEAREGDDRDAAIFERLKRESVDAIRQNPEPADPSAKPKPTRPSKAEEAEAGTRDPTKPSSRETPGKSDEDDTQDSGAYADVDPKTIDVLRRAEMLLEPEEWDAMSQRARDGYVAAARRLIKTKGTLSQMIGQQKAAAKGKATDQQADDQLDADDADGDQDLDDDSAEVDQARTAPAQPPRTPRARGQAQNAVGDARRQQQPAPSKGELNVDAELQAFDGYFGDEVSAPLKKVFKQQQSELTEARRDLQLHQQQMQVQQQQFHTLLNHIYAPQEREAFKALEAETGEAIPKATRDRIVKRAIQLVKDTAGDEEPMTLQEAIEDRGRLILKPDHQRQAQLSLLDRRKQSLRATPKRGNAGDSVRQARTLTPEDRDTRAWEALTAKPGRKGTDVRQMLRE